MCIRDSDKVDPVQRFGHFQRRAVAELRDTDHAAAVIGAHARRQIGQRRPLSEARVDLVYGAAVDVGAHHQAPVSYTHLDVYKRQARGRMAV